MSSIARWTTPSFSYKPSAVQASDIAEIYLSVKQDGMTVPILKDIDSATVVSGAFVWDLSQAETASINVGSSVKVQVDYKTNSGKRFTTRVHSFSVDDSAVQEVI